MQTNASSQPAGPSRRLGWLTAGMAAIAAVGIGYALYSSWTKPQAWDPQSPLHSQCSQAHPDATRATFTADDGTLIGGASIGAPDSPTIVLLRHGASQTICDWLPTAADLSTETGARVVLFDRRGSGATPVATGSDTSRARESADLIDVASAVMEPDRQIVAIASSMGNSVTVPALDQLAAAAQGVGAELCALASVSPVLASDTELADIPEGAMPALYLGWETTREDVDSAATLLTEAAVRDGAPFVHMGKETSAHSLALVESEPDVADLLTQAAAEC